MTTIDERILPLLQLIGSVRLPLTGEKNTQTMLAGVFDAAGVNYEREVKLGPGDIVDFMIDGDIAIECKLRAGRAQIFRQLRRYAEHRGVRALVLLSNTAMGLPESINGRPAYYLSLGKAWV